MSREEKTASGAPIARHLTAIIPDAADAPSAHLPQVREPKHFGTATPVSRPNHTIPGASKFEADERKQTMNQHENQNETAPVAAGAASESNRVAGKDESNESEVIINATMTEGNQNGTVEDATVEGAQPIGATTDDGVVAVVKQMRVDQLRPHPRNDEVYGNDSIADVLKSLKTSSDDMDPLLVTRDGTIISGHRRHRAALELKLETVPVIVSDLTDEVEILSTLLARNCHRTKSKKQIAAECAVMMEIEKKRREHKTNTGRKGAGEKLPPAQAKKSRDAVAKEQGISARSVDKATKTHQAIMQLKAEGRESDASEVTAALDKGFDGGYKRAVEKGVITVPRKKKTGTKRAAPTSTPAAEEADPPKSSPENSQCEKIASEMSGDTQTSSKRARMDSDTALTQLDEVLTFLRGLSEEDLSDQQKRDWRKLFDQLDDCRADLNL